MNDTIAPAIIDIEAMDRSLMKRTSSLSARQWSERPSGYPRGTAAGRANLAASIAAFGCTSLNSMFICM
jgi:hypothetical protein